MMIGLLAMLAVVSAVLVWQWRPHRGPVIVTALWIGQLAAGPLPLESVRHWHIGVTAPRITRARC